MEISNLVQTQGDGFLIRLPSSTRYLYPLREYLIRELSKSIGQADMVHIISGVNEAVENAMIHGNQRQEDKVVEIMCQVTPELFRAVVTDEGEGFDVKEWLAWYENVWRPSIEKLKRGDTLFNLTDYPPIMKIGQIQAALVYALFLNSWMLLDLTVLETRLHWRKG